MRLLKGCLLSLPVVAMVGSASAATYPSPQFNTTTTQILNSQNVSTQGLTAAQATVGSTVSPALKTNAGDFSVPQSGANLGVGAQTYLAPNQVVQGSQTVLGSAPIIYLHSYLIPNSLTLWLDRKGAGNLSVNDPINGVINLFAHNVNIGGSSAGAVLGFYGGGSAPPMNAWQGTDGQGYLQTQGYNLNLSAGTGWISLQSNVQLSTSSTTYDTSKCGSPTGAKGCFIFRDPAGAQSYTPFYQ